MYWELGRVERLEADEAAVRGGAGEGRFVLHRHRDRGGVHLDLRLEQEGYLVGWRIDAAALEEGSWATEKAPHPMHWLERDGDAHREDEGVYLWLDRGPDGGTLELRGRRGVVKLQWSRREGLSVSCMRAVSATVSSLGVCDEDVPGLLEDGVSARRRALARLCGLGRELDGNDFDEAMWRGAMAGRSLEEINRCLQSYEMRFDRKYPPEPASVPEALAEEEAGTRCDRAMAILEAG